MANPRNHTAKPPIDYFGEAYEPQPAPGPSPVAFVRTTEIIHREQPIFADGAGTFGQMIDLQIDAAMHEGRLIELYNANVAKGRLMASTKEMPGSMGTRLLSGWFAK